MHFIDVVFSIICNHYIKWIGEKQKELNINAIQLLFYQAPLSAVFLGVLTILFEPLTGKGGLFDSERLTNEWVKI